MSKCYPCIQMSPCLPTKQKPCECIEKYFSVLLGDVTTYSVAPSVHQIGFVRGVTVHDVNGEEIGVEVNISINQTVAISANISLLNSTLIIF